MRPGCLARIEWQKIYRPTVTIDNPINVTGQLQAALPPQDELDDAVIRLTVRLPKDLRNMIDEASMHAYTSKALTFTMPILIGHDQRSRLSPEEFIGRLTAEELVSLYWDTVNISVDERPALDSLAAEVIRSVESEGMIDLRIRKRFRKQRNLSSLTRHRVSFQCFCIKWNRGISRLGRDGSNGARDERVFQA